MPSRKLLAQIVIGIGIIWTFLWSLIGTAQQAEQIYEQRNIFIRILSWPAAGPLITVAAVIAYVMVRKHDPPARIEEPSASPAAPPTMVGKYLHTFNEQGEQRYQARVLREDGNRLFVQMFSAMDGAPTDQRYLSDAEVATARFYDTHHEWIEAFHRLNRH